MVVLVVDDQTNVAAGIVSGVRWEKLLITKVWTAYNAHEAREILESHPVDIMLCDIEMPVEDGLSLLRWVKQNDIPVLCIFLTAHADFIYAKEAVRLGGFDYILQPARYEDIEKSIQRAQQAINKKRALDEYSAYGQFFYRRRERLLDSVLQDWLKTSSSAEALSVYDDLKALNIPLSGKTPAHAAVLRIVSWHEGIEPWPLKLIRYTLENMLAELFGHYGQSVLLIEWDENTMILLVVGKQGNLIDREGAVRQLARLQGICQNELQFELAFCMEDPIPAAGIPARVARLVSALAKDAGVPVTLPNSATGGDEVPEPDMKDWALLLAQGEGDKVRQEALHYLHRLSSDNAGAAEALFRFYRLFAQAVYSAARRVNLPVDEMFLQGDDTGTSRQTLSSLSGMCDFVSFATGFFDKAVQCGVDQKTIVGQVVEYIQNNIEQDIRREDIAAEIFFSKTYISRLFRRETGVTLKEYIVKAKMQKARELLTATRLPVGAIAAKVGYDNFSHFTQVYKRIYGITPTEERK